MLRALRNGNVSCIEALIQASNHETNDDDVDGRTPLLLACLHGHHQAVQVLLSLGGDVTKRLELSDLIGRIANATEGRLNRMQFNTKNTDTADQLKYWHLSIFAKAQVMRSAVFICHSVIL